MVNLYYNPKLDKLGLGVFYTSSDCKFYLVVGVSDKKQSFDVLDITDKYLDDWEFIDKVGNVEDIL